MMMCPAPLPHFISPASTFRSATAQLRRSPFEMLAIQSQEPAPASKKGGMLE